MENTDTLKTSKKATPVEGVGEFMPELTAPMIRQLYGRAVRRARLQRGMSLLALARKLELGDTSKASLSNIERGKRWPSRELAKRIQKTLGVKAPPVRRYGTGYSEEERRILYQLKT